MADEYFHAEVSDVFTATKVYNWSGEHIAYQANNISIPCDAANGHFRALQGRIANKTCLELEPSITWARKTYSAEGRITGYDWEGGFIPVNLQNRLFKLLSSYIESGTCQVEEPKHIDPVESNIESLLFCIVLDRGWQHLAGALERSFEYRPKPGSSPVNLQVRLHNLPSQAGDVLPFVYEALGVVPPQHPVTLKCLRAAMIEVEVSVALLFKLFRNERARINELIATFVDDQLQQHLVRSGRNSNRGPAIDWLIDMAPYYLTYVVVEIANVALQAFALEYGGNAPGHVTEDALLRSNLIFARHDDGSIRLRQFVHQGDRSFQIQGRWENGLAFAALADQRRKNVVDLVFVSSRIQQLFISGFASEALVIANAAFEIVVEHFLVLAVAVDPIAQEKVRAQSYRQHLELIGKIVSSGTEPSFQSIEFQQFALVMSQANMMRNNYLHQLVPPSQDPWKFAELDRIVGRILSYLTDPFRSMRTLGCLGAYNGAQEETTLLLLDELK